MTIGRCAGEVDDALRAVLKLDDGEAVVAVSGLSEIWMVHVQACRVNRGYLFLRVLQILGVGDVQKPPSNVNVVDTDIEEDTPRSGRVLYKEAALVKHVIGGRSDVIWAAEQT